MYRTCLFCAADLGHNVEIEQFPVGRRLAFDGAHGRLWVVCGKCERWNLTPIEERWEAIEQCERRFRDTRLRVSTDNIGLARLTSGLELVRIGSALRPEMAAWRYGDQFGRRRRRHMVYVGGVLAAGAGIVLAGPVLGLMSTTLVSPLVNFFSVGNSFYRRQKKLSVVRASGESLTVRTSQVRDTRLVKEGDEWSLELSAESGLKMGFLYAGVRDHLVVQLKGSEAIHAAGMLLPHFNRSGAGKQGVQEAVGVLERAMSPEKLFASAATLLDGEARRRDESRSIEKDDRRHARYVTGAQRIAALPSPVRLALEMAAHEDTERRALEGELALLEAAWRNAEQIAAIADDLLTPESDRQFIERNRAPGPSDPE